MKRISAILMSFFLFWCVSGTASVTGAEINANRAIVSSVEEKQISVPGHDSDRGTWIEKYYNTWASGKHNKFKCIECHSVPSAEKSSLEPKFKELGELYTYMSTFRKHSTVRKQLSVNDVSCTSTKCHPSTGTGKEGEYWTKKIDYAQYERADKSKGLVQFTHDKHYDPKKQIEGQTLHCTSCHQHETEKKHFEVALCNPRKKKLSQMRSPSLTSPWKRPKWDARVVISSS
jgi:predicted metal-binding protein